MRMRNELGMVVAGLLIASTGCMDGEPGEDTEAAVAQEIIDGIEVSPENSGWVLVSAGGTCSGTLLHNQWILTAKHCGATVGSTARMGTQLRTIDRAVNHATLDVTVAHLSTPMSMNGSTSRWRRPLRRTAHAVGASLQCYGYGRGTFGGTSGTLRTAMLAVSGVPGSLYTFNANAFDQIQWFGDSGGGCVDADGNAVYVQSTSTYVVPDGPVISSAGPRSDAFADWADRIIYGYFGPQILANGLECLDGEDCHLGDLDADGDDDLVSFTQGTAGGVWVARSNGAVLISAGAWLTGFCTAGQVCRLGDTNGDGRADAIAFDRSSGDVRVALSTGTGFSAATVWNTGACFSSESCEVGDLNGDGRTDVVAFGAGHAWGLTSTGAAFVYGTPAEWHTGLCLGAGSVCKLGDVDGDGRADAIEFVRTNGDVYVARSTGIQFSSRLFWHDWFCVGTEICDAADLDGDGKTDLVAFGRGASGDVWGAISTGTRFLGTGWKWHESFCLNDSVCRMGDVDGDGRSDAVAATNDASADIFLARSIHD